MVDNDSNNSALTLGDDESIAVGDYEIEYNSTDDDWQVTSPDGNETTVPRSTTDSLVPQGLAESVSAGEALADDGNTYASVQTAVDNATGWVFVGPGTFNESVTISTAGLTLEGSGYDTLIDSGSSGNSITINSDNCTINSVSVSNDSGSSTNEVGVEINGQNITVENTTIRDSDFRGFEVNGSGATVTGCKVERSDAESIFIQGTEAIVSSNVFSSSNSDGGSGATSVYLVGSNSSDNSIVVNNIVRDSGQDGIELRSVDCVVIGNRVINSSLDGILIASADTIVANNRVSDSGGTDINDSGTGTVLDSNKTGASN